MNVILLEKVENLGNLGDSVKVRAGYGRNFLIPKGKALPATEANLAEFETRRAELEKRAADALTRANARAAELEGLELEIEANAGPGGKLFGSVTPIDIAQLLTSKGIETEKSEVRIADPIRQIGEYEIGLHLHSDVDVAIKLNVVEAEAE